MSLNNHLNDEMKATMYNLAIFFCGACVLFTTMLNVAFTLMPNTMVQLVKTLIA